MVGRSAFTLIELIFAIVIIAIAVISLPRMTQVTDSGVEGNLVQEAIFIASTELNQAVSAYWDENSLIDGAASSLARVIDNGNCDNNSSDAEYRQKLGHINQPFHRRCVDSNATVISNANANNNVDALDDHANMYNMSTANKTQAGYKFAYSTTIAVTHPTIFGVDQVNANNDMKKISAKVSDIGPPVKIITTLVTYSANIGEVDYYKRTY